MVNWKGARTSQEQLGEKLEHALQALERYLVVERPARVCRFFFWGGEAPFLEAKTTPSLGIQLPTEFSVVWY